MSIRRVATFKAEKYAAAVALEVGGVKLEIQRTDATALASADAVKAKLEQLAATGKVALPRVFVHVNRDESIAIATGEAPRVWPEDWIDDSKTAIK